MRFFASFALLHGSCFSIIGSSRLIFLDNPSTILSEIGSKTLFVFSFVLSNPIGIQIDCLPVLLQKPRHPKKFAKCNSRLPKGLDLPKCHMKYFVIISNLLKHTYCFTSYDFVNKK